MTRILQFALMVLWLANGQVFAGRPEFTLHRQDVIPTNAHLSYSTNPTGCLLTLYLTTPARTRLQTFANANFGQEVILHFADGLSVTSRWEGRGASSMWGLFRPTERDALQLAQQYGVARDCRFSRDGDATGLLEFPIGRTTLYFRGRSVTRLPTSIALVITCCAVALAVITTLTTRLLRRKNKA
jgi:hypothetical protein